MAPKIARRRSPLPRGSTTSTREASSTRGYPPSPEETNRHQDQRSKQQQQAKQKAKINSGDPTVALKSLGIWASGEKIKSQNQKGPSTATLSA
jgi:hypothetical protein